MSDALISPAVGGTLWVASSVAIAYCAKKISSDTRPQLPALMGTMGAFVFAAQMINFSIYGTGSSGHIGGGILLAAILGPYTSFLTISSVLIIQALFFADGGLLALGCNIFNLGVFPCFIAFPLIYKAIIKNSSGELSRTRIIFASLLACIIGLQLGSLGVVAETRLSGISELPTGMFLLVMQPIHLAIGVVEGLATSALLLFLYNMQPSLLYMDSSSRAATLPRFSGKPVFLSLGILTLLIAGVFSWYASSHPDGLEWAIEKTSHLEELATPATPVYEKLGALSEKTALFPDYNLPPSIQGEEASDAGTSLAGIIGGVMTLLLALLIGFGFRRKPTVNEAGA